MPLAPRSRRASPGDRAHVASAARADATTSVSPSEHRITVCTAGGAGSRSRSTRPRVSPTSKASELKGSSESADTSGSALTHALMPAFPKARLTANTPAARATPPTTRTVPPSASTRARSSTRLGRWSTVSNTTAPCSSAATHRESPTHATCARGFSSVKQNNATTAVLPGPGPPRNPAGLGNRATISSSHARQARRNASPGSFFNKYRRAVSKSVSEKRAARKDDTASPPWPSKTAKRTYGSSSSGCLATAQRSSMCGRAPLMAETSNLTSKAPT